MTRRSLRLPIGKETPMNFDHIFNWKLLSGSHDFPGPDGGTCINEAAIIAAGFEYKKVASAADCPPCFSPVLSAYLLGINDMLPDAERQKLMRFVLRLTGSADRPEVEQRRLELIVLRTVQRVVSSAMRAAGLDDHAAACGDVTTFDECGSVAARDASAARAALYADTIAIADEAFAIGNQAALDDVDLVSIRLDHARSRVSA